MRAVGYVRVSTEEQAIHGISLANQRERIQAYAQLYDLEIVGMFVDEGASAGNLNRRGLSEALQALESGYAEAIVVMKLDRLTRNLRDLLDLVSNYFSGKYSLFSVGEHLDPRTPAGRFVMNILAAVAQWELETIRERARSTYEYKRSKGEYTGGGVPFGWRIGYGGVLVADVQEQRVIALAKQLSGQGRSLREIGDRLIGEGLRPRGDGLWQAQQVKRILRSE